MPNIFFITLIGLFLFSAFGCKEKSAHKTPWIKSELLFEDKGIHNWQAKWMLDGERAQILHTEAGMELIAGPEHGNDTCHTVLWTKESFSGNIRIEYDYTRTDTTTRCVNILYFHATGSDNEGYPQDISLWNAKRKVPHMRTYFNNMHAYHISYAAFSAKEYSGDNDYIRLRRYNPQIGGLKGTDIAGDKFRTGLFKPNISYHISLSKYEGQIEMHIQNLEDKSDNLLCSWDVSGFPLYESGRIGFRHMYTRKARYKNIEVWRLKAKP
ncbi:MAG: DUF1961 family protein [Bacteroidia bacterium]|nr:DUF1961 family protein [Bacteroidia bacterium]